MVITTEGFSDVAIAIFPQWDLKPQPLNSVKTLSPTELSGHEFYCHLEPTFDSYSNFVTFFSVLVSSWSLICQSPRLL